MNWMQKISQDVDLTTYLKPGMEVTYWFQKGKPVKNFIAEVQPDHIAVYHKEGVAEHAPNDQTGRYARVWPIQIIEPKPPTTTETSAIPEQRIPLRRPGAPVNPQQSIETPKNDRLKLPPGWKSPPLY